MGATGLMLAVASGFLVACSSVSTKLLRNDLTPFEVTLYRGVLNTMVIYSYLLVNGRGNVLQGVDSKTLANALFRGIMFVSSVALVVSVNQNMPLVMGSGLILALAAGFSVSCESVCIKLMRNDLDPVEVTLYRGVINTVIVYSYLVVTGRLSVFHGVDWNTMASALLRGVLFVSGVTIVTAVNQNMPLGDASALIGSNTIMTGFLGIFILKEKWHLPEILISLFCWAGVVLIARPPFLMGNSEGAVVDDGGHRFFYSMLALCSVVTSSLTMLFARKIGNRLDASRLVLISEMVSAVCCIGIVQTTQGGVHLPPQNAWTYLPVLSLTSIMGQVLMVTSLQTEKAASAVVFRTAGYVTTSFIFQVIIFKNTPELSSIVGAALILSSTAFLSWRQMKQKTKQS